MLVVICHIRKTLIDMYQSICLVLQGGDVPCIVDGLCVTDLGHPISIGPLLSFVNTLRGRPSLVPPGLLKVSIVDLVDFVFVWMIASR